MKLENLKIISDILKDWKFLIVLLVPAVSGNVWGWFEIEEKQGQVEAATYALKTTSEIVSQTYIEKPVEYKAPSNVKIWQAINELRKFHFKEYR